MISLGQIGYPQISRSSRAVWVGALGHGSIVRTFRRLFAVQRPYRCCWRGRLRPFVGCDNWILSEVIQPAGRRACEDLMAPARSHDTWRP